MLGLTVHKFLNEFKKEKFLYLTTLFHLYLPNSDINYSLFVKMSEK